MAQNSLKLSGFYDVDQGVAMRQEEPLRAIVSTQEKTVIKRQGCLTSTTTKITSIIFFL